MQLNSCSISTSFIKTVRNCKKEKLMSFHSGILHIIDDFVFVTTVWTYIINFIQFIFISSFNKIWFLTNFDSVRIVVMLYKYLLNIIVIHIYATLKIPTIHLKSVRKRKSGGISTWEYMSSVHLWISFQKYW